MAVFVAFFAPVAVVLGWSLPSHCGLLVVSDGLDIVVLRGRGLPNRNGRLVACNWLLVVRVGVGVWCVGWWHRIVALLRVPLVGDTRTDQATGTRAQNGAVATTHGLAYGSTGHRTHAGTQKHMYIVCMGQWSHTRQGACQERKGNQGSQSGSMGLGERGW